MLFQTSCRCLYEVVLARARYLASVEIVVALSKRAEEEVLQHRDKLVDLKVGLWWPIIILPGHDLAGILL